MAVYMIDKKTFRRTELKSWVWTILIVVIFYFVYRYALEKDKNHLLFVIGVVLFTKFFRMLTQSFVNLIQVNKTTGKLNIRLNSLMTGYDYKSYDLKDVQAELTESKSWFNFYQTSLELKIYLPRKRKFVITNRYGFTDETLRIIDEDLNFLNK